MRLQSNDVEPLSWLARLSSWIGGGCDSKQDEQFRSHATRKDGTGSGDPIFSRSDWRTVETVQQCAHDKWLEVSIKLLCAIYSGCVCSPLCKQWSIYNCSGPSWRRLMAAVWICPSSDNSQVFQREVLRSRRNSTTVVNRPNMVPDFINTRSLK